MCFSPYHCTNFLLSVLRIETGNVILGGLAQLPFSFQWLSHSLRQWYCCLSLFLLHTRQERERELPNLGLLQGCKKEKGDTNKMIAQSRLLGTRSAAQKKKQKKSKTANALAQFPYLQDPSVITGSETQRDPYALPRRESKRRPGERVVLSKDPLIRVMMDEKVDVDYEKVKKLEEESVEWKLPTISRQSSKKLDHWKKRISSFSTRLFPSKEFDAVTQYCKAHLKLSSKTSGCSPFRTHGRVTAACLWHACRVVTIGILLMGIGIVMSILGKSLQSQRSILLMQPS